MAGWTPWVLGLGLLLAVGLGTAALGTSGFRTTDSGLQYQIIKPGDAARGTPHAGDAVLVHYIGRKTDGEMFDSSYMTGRPAQFVLAPGALIPGFLEAVQLMHPKEQLRVKIPAALAYGEKGAGDGVIPPNADLIFDLELLDYQSPRGAPRG